ncbi:MAG TPA: SDR family oxidoreductase [Kofleriaceae bacterium]|nr:SDR family oxidoreductase [Kofleriaceae bacterium]
MVSIARRFVDQVAIVTGAASGIGRAIARRLADEGARVVLADLDHGAAQVAASELPDAMAQRCDVSVEADVAATTAAAVARWGRLDVIVNNAGLMVFKPLAEHTAEDWMRVLRVDLLGAFYFTRAAFAHMQRGGAIVNVASIHAVETTPLVASYAAAKAALLSLTRSTVIEGRDRGIRANAILPGAVDTPMLWANPNLKTGLETVSAADVGKPEEIAAAVAFLASADASFVCGASLRADGGRLSRL